KHITFVTTRPPNLELYNPSNVVRSPAWQVLSNTRVRKRGLWVVSAYEGRENHFLYRRDRRCHRGGVTAYRALGRNRFWSLLHPSLSIRKQAPGEASAPGVGCGAGVRHGTA